ncbi:lanthionine synthetase C family protein [Saccharopolyspora rosea]|uniref:Lanthionine synthetase C family protein n=1 Tax=Saccharopolyspora rosea TaxID=524884 RepID=A0ABW3FXU4_9PSEU
MTRTSPPTWQAAEITAELAARLADPEHVARIATTADNTDHLPGMSEPVPPWGPIGLGEAHTGVAVLYAELAHHDPALRRVAHAHLSRAAAAAEQCPPGGLFGGLASLAHAAALTRRSERDYATLLDQLDDRITRQLRDLLAAESARLDAGRPGARMDHYDTVNGASGLGRYLLLRGNSELLGEVLRYLVRLSRPLDTPTGAVPGWWIADSGRVDLGLSHGICGPLALLALAWEERCRVPGQREAIELIAEQLLGWRTERGLWPATAESPPGTEMTAWCYGTPGVARALYLAGRALRRQDWCAAAVTGLATALDLPDPGITDCSLCHGWSGVLRITQLMTDDSGDPRLAAHLPRLATEVVAAHDPAHPFGFAYRRRFPDPAHRPAPHRAGFLEGAAGIALALHSFSAGAASRWDSALLVS